MPEDRAYPRIDAMGESALLVTLGSGVSRARNRRVHELTRRLRECDLLGIEELVPAYASLLVVLDSSLLERQAVISAIERALYASEDAEAVPGARHIIPVHYGGDLGPDLDSLSRSKGLTPKQVLELHSNATYTVYFLGFMPGFAYMGGLNPRLATPRLPSPRVRIPAGSVGIAGEQTGIYPLSSPGGWQLIGRSTVPVWDVEKEPPALLSTGDEVRFVPTKETPDVNRQRTTEQDPEAGAYPAFAVEAAGGMTLLQDLGRPGYAHLGLSRGGVMSPDAAVEANRLVGNSPGAAVLELTFSGPTLRALSTTVIALMGADLGCHIGGLHVPPGVSWLVRAGSVVRFAGAAGGTGNRTYLAVGGGFSAPLVLGSRSTYLPGAFGGYQGRTLAAGNTLWGLPSKSAPAEVAGKLGSRNAPTIGDRTLRFIPFEGPGCVPQQALSDASETVFTVSPSSDRMGVRLEAEQPERLAYTGGELTTFGVVRGAIQLPPAGTPIILGADHQTTGGYPLLGVVSRADWPVLAQLGPGDTVRLQPVALTDAIAARAGG